MAKKDGKKKGFVPQKKRGGGGARDDESMDSKGNIKGLINYDYNSETDDDYLTESDHGHSATSGSGNTPIARRTRSNSLRKQKDEKKNKLVKKSAKYSESEESETESESDSEIISKLRKEKRKLQQKLREREEDERLEEEEEKLAAKRRARRRKMAVESDSEEEEEEDDEEDEDEEDEEDADDEGDEDEEDEDDDGKPQGIVFSFGGLEEGMDRMVPRRHNMKKESDEVKKFVKLLTTPSDEDTIDGQIDQFKAMPTEQRTKLLAVLENRNKNPNAQQGLMFKILTMNLPEDVQSMVLSKYNNLQNLDPGTSEYFKHRNWLEKLTSLPLGIYKELPVKITDGSETCGSFMEKARKSLDGAIYGQDEAKLQILQFIATKIANPDGRGLSLLLSGPPGIGKTSLIKNGVAKAIQWPFQFVSLGGDSDASTYTGHQLVYESSHCGKIVNSLAAA